ncbi:hypothetical protein [Streptomyces albireticuli]|uniref:hypothetical protein n=1 Tax=Streptomyces albireticuli TaxID=1940 RepID=UPI00118076DA|nr:hypothetical protein [Streptomyces albireticuli]MCD9196209.1 hypothetical protein [Streptomyces albireticuli]
MAEWIEPDALATDEELELARLMVEYQEVSAGGRSLRDHDMRDVFEDDRLETRALSLLPLVRGVSARW